MTPESRRLDGVTMIKLGGSVLTDKAGTEAARPEVIERLSEELASALPERCVVGHGSGSFGHRAAIEQGCGDGIFRPGREPAAEATRATALRLHQQVLAALVAVEVDVASLPPADWCRWQREGLQADSSCVISALARGAVPLVMGDVVPAEGGGARIASTEEVFVALAQTIPVRVVVWVGDTDGILDEAGKPVARLGIDEAPALREAAGADVTGGMALRWRAVCQLATAGAGSLLVNGLREGELRSALTGGPIHGTRVSADS